MAENRNITWNCTLTVDSNVTTPYNLYLQSQSLSWGKWATNPPSTITAPAAGSSTNFSFEAEGAECSATGTEGTVVYVANDNLQSPTTFTFTFDIPYSSANSGNATISSGAANGNYDLDNGGGVPVSGNSVSVDVTITQTNPTT
jgi:Aegerolysin